MKALMAFLGIVLLTTAIMAGAEDKPDVEAIARAQAEVGYYQRMISKYTARTDDLAPLEFALSNLGYLSGGTTTAYLSVPKAYITWKPSWRGGEIEWVDIQAYLPDFVPISLVKDPDDKRTVYIKLKRGCGKGKGYCEQEYIKYRLSHRRLILISNSSVQGMKEYRDDFKDSSSSYFIPANTYDGNTRLIDCVSTIFPKGRCTIMTDYDEDIRLSYSIPRSEIVGWEKVDKQVHEFVKTLIVEPADVVCWKEECLPLHKTTELSAIRRGCVNGAKKGFVEAEKKCTELAQAGDYWGYHQLGLLQLKKDKAKAEIYFNKAFEVMKKKSSLADRLALAMVYLHEDVYRNYLVNKDVEEAVELMEDVAAESAKPSDYTRNAFYIHKALMELGISYRQGRNGIAKNQKKAFEHLMRASEVFSDSLAQKELGWMYAKGEGVEKNPLEALKYARISRRGQSEDKMIEEFSKGLSAAQLEKVRSAAVHWWSAYMNRWDPLKQ